jgi:hypothetical protein
MSNSWPFVKSEPISLDGNPELGLNWIYERIAEDPEILGLGAIRIRERVAAEAGASCRQLVSERAAAKSTCAVVVKTGATDDSQLVEAIEAWGREWARNGQTPVEAVMVAEQISPRFLNVASLISNRIPIRAVQMQAIRVGQAMTVIFTPLAGSPDTIQTQAAAEPAPPSASSAESPAPADTATLAAANPVSAERSNALDDALTLDEPSWDRFEVSTPQGIRQLAAEPVVSRAFLSDAAPIRPIPDRGYWERSDHTAVAMADQLLSAVQALDPTLELDYQENYIGLARGGEPVDFARFRPEPGALVVGLRLERNPLIELGIAQAGLEQLREGTAEGYALRLSQADFEAQRGPASRLMRLAYEESRG